MATDSDVVFVSERRVLPETQEVVLVSEVSVESDPVTESPVTKKPEEPVIEKPKLPVFTCDICKDYAYGYGNNPQPVCAGKCCDDCNMVVVIPRRNPQIPFQHENSKAVCGWCYLSISYDHTLCICEGFHYSYSAWRKAIKNHTK
jgi:hypothetical protein